MCVRGILTALILALTVICVWPQTAESRNRRGFRIKPRHARAFRWTTLKRAIIVKKEGKLFAVVAHETDRPTSYVVKAGQGLLARMARFLTTAKKKRVVAVGGRYFLGPGRKGWVRANFVRPLRSFFRGVKVVKIDGHMPTFSASVLREKDGSSSPIYLVRGKILASYDRLDNKLVCVYGSWFDFPGRKAGIVSQQNGILGRPLKRFARQFRKGRSWWNIRDFDKKLAAYRAWRKSLQAARQAGTTRPTTAAVRPKLGLFPTLSPTAIAGYWKTCRERARGKQ